MSNKVRISWNYAGFRALRTDRAVMKMLDKKAEAIAKAAGDGFEAKPAHLTGGRVRGRAAVVATTRKAAAAEARDHVLLNALSAARG